MKRRGEIPDRLIIKNAKFGMMDLFYIIVFAGGLYGVSQIEKVTFSMVLFIIMLGVLPYSIIHRLKNDEDQIVINKEGITLSCKSRFFIDKEKMPHRC